MAAGHHAGESEWAKFSVLPGSFIHQLTRVELTRLMNNYKVCRTVVVCDLIRFSYNAHWVMTQSSGQSGSDFRRFNGNSNGQFEFMSIGWFHRGMQFKFIQTVFMQISTNFFKSTDRKQKLTCKLRYYLPVVAYSKTATNFVRFGTVRPTDSTCRVMRSQVQMCVPSQQMWRKLHNTQLRSISLRGGSASHTKKWT